MTTLTRPFALMACAATIMLFAGCESTPNRGDSGGRSDPYASTDADRGSRKASFPALLEFSDQVAARLVQDLMQIPEIRESDTKVIMALGGISNKTRTPHSDFELIQRRLRAALINSDYVSDHVLIVENRQRMDRELQRVANDTTGANIYDPDKTYVLLGDFFEANRGGRRYYYFEFSLANLKGGGTVFVDNYDLAQN